MGLASASSVSGFPRLGVRRISNNQRSLFTSLSCLVGCGRLRPSFAPFSFFLSLSARQRGGRMVV